MNAQVLTGEMLFNLFVSGGNYIIENKEDLNKINVFPVPDGDTGTNLASTFSSIIENGNIYNSAGKTMQSIAEEALIGARGNSGIIFAQFLSGLSSAIGESYTVTVDTFSEAVKKGVNSAFEAISNPVEGTMLSVIRDWSDTILVKTPKLNDFYLLFSDSVETAKKLLRETTDKLKDLREAHVVDAGAKGFVHFLQGAYDFLKTGVVRYPKAEAVTIGDDVHEELVENKELRFRYCTEALIRSSGQDAVIDKNQIKKLIEPYGASLIVAGTESNVRIHIHTNRPAEVFHALRPFGSLAQQKADDMGRQQETVYHRKYPIALVTDSVCDLPQHIIDEYQIHVIPLHLLIDDDEYLDKLTITPEKFFGMLDSTKTYPTTSQPSSRTIANLYSFLSTYYESIIAIHLSGAMSGTFNASRQQAEKIKETKITVIDSKQLSGSLGLIVRRAAEEIAAGKSHEEVVKAVEDFIPKADNFVSVQTLKYMVKGGRVSPLKGMMAKIMNLKPIVSVDTEGNSVLYGKAFSKRSNMKKIIRMVTDIHNEHPLRSYAVVHAHAPDSAQCYADALDQAIGFGPDYVMDISPIVALNAGLGAVSVVTMKE